LRLADLLTWYRIAAAPVVVAMALLGWRDAFYILLMVSFASDLIDGPVARMLRQTSARGARLDTWADGMTVVVGLIGIYIFESEALRPQAGWILAFLQSYAAAAVVCLFKFARLPSYHLYTSKAAAALSGVFVLWLYLFGFSQGMLILTVCVALIANTESVLVTLRLKAFRTNLPSLLVLKRVEKRGG